MEQTFSNLLQTIFGKEQGDVLLYYCDACTASNCARVKQMCPRKKGLKARKAGEISEFALCGCLVFLNDFFLNMEIDFQQSC